MGSISTLLCIHRDPSQLSLLQEHGYELVTATNGSDGLRLFMLQAVDAIVLDYQLGLLDGGVVAAEIKKIKPEVPIVMLAEDVELPHDALKSVDAIVSKSDGPHLLLASVRSVLDGRWRSVVKEIQRLRRQYLCSLLTRYGMGPNAGRPTLPNWQRTRTLHPFLPESGEAFGRELSSSDHTPNDTLSGFERLAAL